MRISRVFIDDALAVGASVPLPNEQSHYVGRVLRLRVGAELTLFNGRGGEYRARLTDIQKRNARVDVLAFVDIERESSLDARLVLGVSRGERMDLSIQKAVELGVQSIYPVEARRSVTNVRGERAERRQIHWQQVARSACEQCGRNTVPRIAVLQSIGQFLIDWPGDELTTGIVLAPTATARLSALQPEDGRIALLIGPEGGLDDEEIQLAVSAGFTAVSLGQRVLRTETAAIATLAAAQTLWGDLG